MQTPPSSRARPPWRAVAVAAVVALLTCGPPLAARASEPATTGTAEELYELGMAHFRARGFSEAARAFEAALALDPRPEILFALAQATRLSGDCPAARPLYQRFLATEPPPHQVEATRIALARCEGRAPPPGPVVAPLPAPPAVQAAAVPRQPQARWWADPLGGALAGAAVLSLGAGVGLLVAARLADGEHREALAYPRANERRAAAQNRQRWAAVALLSGAALGVGAAGRWWWLGGSAGGPAGRAALALGGRF